MYSILYIDPNAVQFSAVVLLSMLHTSASPRRRALDSLVSIVRLARSSFSLSLQKERPQKSNTTMASIRKQELSLLKQRDLICSIPTPIIDRPAQDHHDTVCGISKSQGMNLSAEQCGKYPHSISQFISDPRGVNHHCKLPHVQRKSVVVVPHSSRLGNAIQKVIAVAVVQGIVSLSSSSSSSSSFLFAVTSNSCCLIDVTW
jgi:hypothetical protein